MVKTDTKNAFKNASSPVPTGLCLFCFEWNGQFYFDKCLPMGFHLHTKSSRHSVQPFSGWHTINTDATYDTHAGWFCPGQPNSQPVSKQLCISTILLEEKTSSRNFDKLFWHWLTVGLTSWPGQNHPACVSYVASLFMVCHPLNGCTECLEDFVFLFPCIGDMTVQGKQPARGGFPKISPWCGGCCVLRESTEVALSSDTTQESTLAQGG